MSRYVPPYKNRELPTEPDWYRKAAIKIVREGKNMMLAVDELGIEGLMPKDIDIIYKGVTFQAILRNERLRFATEWAKDPALNKDAAVGMMLIAIDKLFLEGEWDKALEGLNKLSKLTGWLGADNSVTVFADLKQKDYEELKRRVEVAKTENIGKDLN